MKPLVTKTKSSVTVWGIVALSALAILTTVAAYYFLPLPSDWLWSYRTGALKLLAGQSPYEGTLFLNAPWVLIPLMPLALLPDQLGRAAFFTFSLACLIFTSVKLKAKPFGLAAILISYPVIYGLIYGQIDPVLSLGYILPPSLGLFFALAKPQTGIAVAIYWAAAAYREGGARKLILTFLPVTIAFVLAYLLFGNWFARSGFQINQGANASLFPWSVPVGIFLTVAAIRQQDVHLSISASPLLSPYVGMHSWENILLGVAPNTTLTLITSAIMWGIFLSGHGPRVR